MTRDDDILELAEEIAQTDYSRELSALREDLQQHIWKLAETAFEIAEAL